MARPRNDRAATETHAVTEPGFRRARKPLALSPCRQPAVRTAGQRSIRVTGLGDSYHSLPRTGTCFHVFLYLSHIQGQGRAEPTFERVSLSLSHPWGLR